VILDTAAQLFSTIGYTESGMRQIAEMAGMRPASVYYHFPSKEAILLEVLQTGLEHTVKRVTAAVDELSEDASAREKIEAAIAAHLRAIHSNLVYTSVNIKFAGQLPRDVDMSIQPLREEYVRYWRDLFEQAQKRGELKRDLRLSLVRPLVMGMMQRTAVWFDAKSGSIDPLIDTVLGVLSGLWAEGASKPVGGKKGRSHVAATW
jgi:AcrR family transcriptional regulator